MRGRGGPPRGGRGGGGFRGGRGGGRGGFQGPPESVIEVGEVMHTCQDELVVKCTLKEQVPYFNGRIFLHNKQEVGMIDEILGPINEPIFSVKLKELMKAQSFKAESKLFIDPGQILPLSRFLPKPAIQKTRGGGRGGRGGGRGGAAGRGGASGGRGGSRGGFSRGGRGGGGRGGRGFGAPRGRGRGG